MNKLVELTHSLKSYYVVVVENDLTHIDDAELILGHFVQLSEKYRDGLIKNLTEEGYDELEKCLNTFNSEFVKTPPRDEAEFLLPDNIRRYLKDIEKEEILTGELLHIITDCLENDTEDEFKNLLLKHRIFKIKPEAEEVYISLLKILDSIANLKIAFYNENITADKIEKFRLDIEKGISQTESLFFLAIIDKHLGEGDVHGGKDFINNVLMEEKPELKQKFVGFLLTNVPHDISPKSYEDYFVREIGKKDPNLIETMVDRMAHAVYAEVFNSLKTQYENSAIKALELALVDQKNIKYIVQESLKEGIPSYEAVSHWFKLTHESKFEQTENENLNFIGGLTNFFNENFLSHYPNEVEISDQLQELSTAEIFDRNINKRYAFPGSGDVYRLGDDYFVLVGQVCDLALRSDNTRNMKVAELLHAKFVAGSGQSDKLKIQLTNSGLTISILHFEKDGVFGTLEIDVNNQIFVQFELLDIGAYNDEGRCAINIDAPLASEIEKVVASEKVEYFKKLQHDIITVQKAKPLLQEVKSTLLGHLNYGLFDMNAEEDGNIDFNLRRVARIKGRFNDFVSKSYFDFKGRIELNTVNQTLDKVSVHKIKFGFPELLIEEADIRLFDMGGEVYVTKEDLLSLVSSKYKTVIVNFFPDKIRTGLLPADKLDGDKYYELKRNGDKLNLTIHYIVDIVGDKTTIHSKKGINAFQLLSGGKPDEQWFKYRQSKDGEDIEWRKNGGEVLNIDETIGSEGGIYIDSGNVKVYVEGGIIKADRNE